MATKSKCENCIESKDFVFGILKSRDKELLRRNHTCLHFKKGETIFKEGDKPNGLICLSAGKVKIFKEGVGGRDQIIRMAKPVKFIGYRALFAEDTYIATAEALEDSTICVIDKEILFKLIRTNPDLSLRFIKLLAEELGFQNKRTMSLTQKHVRGRMAESLLVLIDTFGYESDKKTLKITLSREDLAGLSNMTTSNAIRTLSNFATEEVIEIEARKIKILDLERLHRISEMG